jgi:ribosomal protein S18 acetylase RimI-like enzyme
MSNHAIVSVLKAQTSDRERCIAALVTAFTNDPLLRWMLPDPAVYLTFFPRVVRFYGGRAFDHDSAYRTDDDSACALWLPPGVGPDEEALGAVVQEAVDPARLDEVFAVLEQVGKAHPQEPHWFLPAIGVDPRHQGRGHGSALLARSLEACDRDHAVAYLEASNVRNVPLYQRFGFDVVGEIQAGSSPVVVPMVRKAR